MKNNVTRMSLDEVHDQVAAGQTETDWDAVDEQGRAEPITTMTDEDDFDWTNATWELPQPKKQLTVRFDVDVVEWFRSQGAGYQTRMNQVLRRYVEAQKD